MLRLQTPLPERYTAASADDLADRIASAKAALGDRLFILGHHYQRDDVIRWADARGDSYRLSVLAQQRPEADVIVWDGGNNDFSFFAPDLLITVTDPLRPGHELRYHPGELNLRMADVVVVNKVDAAPPPAVGPSPRAR